MIIDAHSHFQRQEYNPPEYWQRRAKAMFETFQLLGTPKTMEEVEAGWVHRLWETDGRSMVDQMDEAGIAVRVLAAIDHGPGVATIESVERENRETSEIASKYEGRFIYFCGVDPRRNRQALDLFTRAVDNWGARGLKLIPVVGFYLDSRENYPLLEKAASLGLPVLTHTGTYPKYVPSSDSADYAHPRRLDAVLRDFPGLKVIAAHMAFQDWEALVEQAQRHPNLVCDISANQVLARTDYPGFCRTLRAVLDGFGKERVLFGTDLGQPITTDRQWVDIIKGLPARPGGVSFTEDEVYHILEANGEKLFGINV